MHALLVRYATYIASFVPVD